MNEENKNTYVKIPAKELFLRTQICFNWKYKGFCEYGEDCKFAHGDKHLKPRIRIQNYKSKPCADLFKPSGCPFKTKCSYTHSGEPMRAPQNSSYYDDEYFAKIKAVYDKEKYPFGIFL